ncbi:MAG TPA: hypothetical protein VNB78_02110 [Sphingomicrobium sp.]|jgi:hypothetical protein|nr:hypothetical protein [Sphingomicrobium sp.]
MKFRLLAIFALLIAAPVAAQQPRPLFAANDVINITIKGPISTLMRNRASANLPGSLLSPTGETLPILLSVRGITRRTSDVCSFPPLRVQFATAPPPTSIFAGQRRLKLVTHCQDNASFQQYVLLEYTAYRMYNQLTPLSMRARLANVTYIQDDGRPVTTRLGYFLEESSDIARRNGLKEIHAPDRIPETTLSPIDAARYALFQHMIANHDWSMRAGPAGEDCCHNARLIGRGGIASGTVVPIPYDFDFSGFVSAPYATPPDVLHIDNVRQRVYRGYCIHNAQAAVVAAQMRAARPQMMAMIAETPGLIDKTRARAAAFVDQFFALIATDADTQSKVLKRCL